MLANIKGIRKGIVPLNMVYGLAGAVFLSTLGVGVFAFAIPLLALHQKTSGLLLGTAFSGYFLAKLVISPIAGKMADRTGPKFLLISSALLGLLAPLAAFASRNYEILYAIQFCLGLSAGTMKPVSIAAIASVTPERRKGRVFGLCNTLYYCAFFLAPFVGGLLFFNRDLTPVLIFLISCTTLSLAIIALVTPSNLPTAMATIEPPPHNTHRQKSKAGTLLLAVAGRTSCTACLITFYPALLSENLHGPTWLLGLIFAVPSLITCVCLPLGGLLADRHDRRSQTIIGMALSAVSLTFVGQMGTPLGFIAIGVVLGIGSSLSFPSSMALASSLGWQQGKIMGWFHGAANTGFVIGPFLSGLLVEQYGGISLSMVVMGILGLLATLPLAEFRFGHRKELSYRKLAPTIFSICLLAIPLSCFGDKIISPFTLEQPSKAEHVKFAGVAMGNVVHITLIGENADQGGKDSQKAFDTIHRLEAEFGHRNISGAIGRINSSAGIKPEPIGQEAFTLVKRALDVCKKSNGIFDITIGAVTTLPHYYQEKAEHQKAELIDYQKVAIDETHQTVFLPKQGMALDLGGLAKGTILDAAASTLQKEGVPSALVEAGGDLICYGDTTWRIGIQDPRDAGLLGVINVANVGVCGSGDYYQYSMVNQNGTTKRKHHILDPAQLDSADKSIAVTVVAPYAELADALATTLFILGPKKGKILLQSYKQCSALWVLPDKTIVTSKTFPQIIKTTSNTL